MRHLQVPPVAPRFRSDSVDEVRAYVAQGDTDHSRQVLGTGPLGWEHVLLPGRLLQLNWVTQRLGQILRGGFTVDSMVHVPLSDTLQYRFGRRRIGVGVGQAVSIAPRQHYDVQAPPGTAFGLGSIVWAAGRDSGPEIRAVTADSAASQALTVDLATAASRRVEYEIRGRSAFGPELSPFSGTAEVEAGDATISVPAAALKPANGWPGGRVIFDVILRDPETGATLNWGNATFEVPKPANLTGLTPATDTYRRGESLSAVVRASGDLSGLTVRFKVSDDLGRELLADSRPARPGRSASGCWRRSVLPAPTFPPRTRRGRPGHRSRRARSGG